MSRKIIPFVVAFVLICLVMGVAGGILIQRRGHRGKVWQ